MKKINKIKLLILLLIPLNFIIAEILIHNFKFVFLTLSIIFTLIFFLLQFHTFKNFFLFLISLFFCFFFIELFFNLHKIYKDALNKVEFLSVGWENEDAKIIFNKDSGLNIVKDYYHGKNHPEYYYKINTEECFSNIIRGKCYINAKEWHFGDSFTFGFGVENEETFVNLKNEINSSINFGIPGHNPIQMFRFAQKALYFNPYEKPDKVWFHFFMGNDVGESIKLIDPKNKYYFPDSKPPSKISLILKKSFFLRQFENIDMKVSIFLKGLPFNIYWVPGHLESNTLEYWNKTKDLFLRYLEKDIILFKHMYEGNIFVSLIPPKEICIKDNDWHKITKDLKIFFNKHNIKTFDYLEYKNCPDLVNDFFKLDTHFSKTGHLEYFNKILKNN